MRPILTFEKLTPGDNLGTNRQYFDDEVATDWLELFPKDEKNLPELPSGMISAITMRAYC